MLTYDECALLTHGILHNCNDGNQQLFALASLAHAGATDIAFVFDSKHSELAQACRAGLLVVNARIDATNTTQLIVKRPQLALAILGQRFAPLPTRYGAAHAAACIAATAQIGSNVSISPHVVIEEDVVIGDGCVIGAGVFIGRNSQIAAACIFHPQSCIYHESKIGERVILHSGCRIGADGFGYVRDGAVNTKIAQLGGVVIGSDVEIGANTCIDRATFPNITTTVGNRVKIDNLCQLAHNVTVDDDTVISAGCLIGGSTVVGARCTIGGSVVISDHMRIADDVTISGFTTVIKNIMKAGRYSSGFIQLFEHRQWQKMHIRLKKILESKTHGNEN